jgi:hypothetical protein
LTTATDISTYESARQRMEAQAAAEFRVWWESLSVQQQKEARSKGIDGPSRDTTIAPGHSPHEQEDIADSDLARTEDRVEESLEETLAELFNLTAAKAQTIAKWHRQKVAALSEQGNADQLARIIGPFLRESNPKIAVAGLAFALGMDALNGLGTIRQYAKRIGVSAEAISKKQVFWRKELNLPLSANGKSESARKSLSKAQQKGHYKKQTYKSTPIRKHG